MTWCEVVSQSRAQCLARSRHAGLLGSSLPLSMRAVDAEERGLPRPRGGAGRGTLPNRGPWSLFLQRSIPPVPSVPVTQSGPAGGAPRGYSHLPKPPQVSPTGTSSQPQLPWGPISLLTLALMGPTRFQNEMTDPPEPTASARGSLLGNGWAPKIGGGDIALLGAVDAFTPLR